MDKNALKENIIKSLIEKRDYKAVTDLMNKDEEKGNGAKMIKLMEPISAFADMLTENTQGVMMEQLEKQLEDATTKGKGELRKDLEEAHATLKTELQDAINTNRKELSSDILNRVTEAQGRLQETLAHYADSIVTQKADSMFADLSEMAKLSPDEIQEIIDEAALSVETQISSVIGDYILETGITSDQITDFNEAVRKLLPKSQQVTWDSIVGKPDFSPGGSNSNLVRALIAEALANNPGGSSTFIDLTDTPATYVGQTGKFPKVNAGETGLEFVAIAGGGDMLAANNLSDVASVATSRTNLGLGTAAQSATTDFAAALGVDDNYVTDVEKTKLSNLSGTNTGDQTSIVGITGTKAQFDTAVTDGNFMYVGDAPTAHTHLLAAGATDVTASAAEVNILDGATLSTTELNYVDGVTSAIQTQLNAKLTIADIDDTPVNGETAAPISSNWAFDHEADTSTHGVTTVAGISEAQVFTNKRNTKRVLALSANSAAPAINTDLYDVVHITAQTATITSFTTNLTGTPVDGDTLRISITGTATVPFTLGSSFEGSGGVPLSATTSDTVRFDMGFFWNTETNKWRQVAAT